MLALAPYVARYRGRAFLAFIALTVAAVTTLMVPIAVRRVVDFGLSPEGIAMINSYFGVMVALVAVLAGASAARFYLVMTIGERIVADLRRDVFAHLVSLSPSFFDSARSGELVSRLTADSAQIKSAVGASASVALRNLMLFVGATAMMVITSPRLSGFVLLAIPIIVIPLVAFGRWVRRLTRSAQDRLGEAAAYVGELVGVDQDGAGLYQRSGWRRHAMAARSSRPMTRRAGRIRRARILTAIIIFIVFTSVVIVLWVGSRDVLEGTITPGRLGQFVLYAVFAAAGLGQLSEVWSELSAASGAAERMFELLRVKPEIAAPAAPRALPQPARGDVGFDHVSFAYPTRPDVLAVDGVSLSVAAGEKVAIVGPSGAGKSTLFHLLLRFYDPKSGAISFDGVPIKIGRSAGPARAHRAGAAGFGGVRGQRARKHPLRPAGCQRCRGRARRRSGARHRIHPPPAGRIRSATRRARRKTVRRPAPAHRDRARDPARCAAVAAGRSDLRARCRKRDAGADRAGRIDAPPHHARDRAPPRHRAVLRPHPGDGPGQASSSRAPTPRWSPPTGFMRGWRDCSSRASKYVDPGNRNRLPAVATLA